jgi:hypothetical protein
MNHTNLEIAVCKTFCLVMILYIFTAKTRAIPTVFDVFFSWLQQCHISRILEISCGDAASPARDAAPALRRCSLLPLEMYYLLERCTSSIRDAASPECGCRVSGWRCGISTGDLQNSGYVTLLAIIHLSE